MGDTRHQHALKLASHHATQPWVCDACTKQGAAEALSRQCAACGYDECLACFADSARRTTAPISLHALLEAQVVESDAKDLAERAEDAKVTKALATRYTGSHESNVALLEPADVTQGTTQERTEDKEETRKPEYSAQLVDAAEKRMGCAPIDCLEETRTSVQLILVSLLGKELSALVTEYAPFHGTEDLPLRMARLTNAESAKAGWTAVAVDEWRDKVYAARGQEIRVYDAFGYNGSLFAEHFASPIRCLALAPVMPHAILCVIDGAGKLHLLGTNENYKGCATTLVDLGGLKATCVCVDPVSCRLFVGVGDRGAVRLLPCASTLLAANGDISWQWEFPSRVPCLVRGLAFSAVSRRLTIATNVGLHGRLDALNLEEDQLTRLTPLTDEEVRARIGVMGCARTTCAITLDFPRALCLEARSNLLFVCEADCVTAIQQGLASGQFSTPSIALKGPRAVALHGRRRILYVAGARHVQAFEVTCPVRRFSPSFIADSAAVSTKATVSHLGITKELTKATVSHLGITKELTTLLLQDASHGIGSALSDVRFLGDEGPEPGLAVNPFVLPDQTGLGPFYTLGLQSAVTRADAGLYAKGIEQCADLFDEYAPIDCVFGLHARAVLRAFNQGALWAHTEAAFLALKYGSALRGQSRRVLSANYARGSVWAGELLARNLLQSSDAREQDRGFTICLQISQVERCLDSFFSLISRDIR